MVHPSVSETPRTLVALAAAAGLAAACGDRGAAPAPDGGWQDDRSIVQVASSNVQGKNVYIPSTIVVTAGRGQVLSLHNTTDVPHGFTIEGIGIEEVLPPGEEHTVELPADLEGGRAWHVRCHLHPAHRTGTLLVLPADRTSDGAAAATGD
jgi:hypothetical protein